MTDEMTENLPRRITEAREAAGLTRAQLSQRMGVTPDTVDAWEDGERVPRANRLVVLGGILGVTPAWLLTGEGDDPGAASMELGPGRIEVQAELDAIRADLDRATAALQRLSERLG
ncbi:MAG: helix-turn-helix domain-containing protein [Minwuia sp.]|uniref:helix-turn-helix domain-containing protein n=1 Tax=Minwuia sp. TaxID=2493630 RepID=UPI003A8A4559